jgi:hypothetical protein
MTTSSRGMMSWYRVGNVERCEQEAAVMPGEWSIEGSEGEPIIGNAHLPEAPPGGVVLVAHGFKGYKDYGMFPRIAESLANRGFIAHRFNFSHSGMTGAIETFERPDLFERDTWNPGRHRCRRPRRARGQGVALRPVRSLAGRGFIAAHRRATRR